ncbi:MAG: hypothetical protein JWN56_506 [Sphingobacteriales bacterium]|nr:hypothetical protein [Sphingobacteriales bacterium]
MLLDTKMINKSANNILIGAEIFIEPGQTPAEIDNWFRILKEQGMYLTRIRMFENYMRNEEGEWDFTLFDYAFKAGEKYGINIYGNLFPSTSFDDVGGFKFPRNNKHLELIAEYIEKTVTHFKQYSSLYGWVPINEPGSGEIPIDEFSIKKFEEWKIEYNLSEEQKFEGFNHFKFEEERFLVSYNIWFLNWLVEQIHVWDPDSNIHVNNHQLFLLAAEYDFKAWRSFLTSLGGSAHASWHFGYFERNKYALAMSANSEMLRSGAGEIPWLMTELQGGNNTYSGFNAMCPTNKEIVQWLWITIATESKGSVFWCLNPRNSGLEAGEWGLVDYQDNASDRLTEVGNIAKFVNENQELFAEAKVLESGISILYTRESLWIEKKQQTGGKFYEGRNIGGVMKSAIAYFEAFSEMGLQINFKELSEFNFEQEDFKGKTIVLAHQISIPSTYYFGLESFVRKGGKLIVDGLTAYYDENAICTFRNFPLKNLFGGSVKEFKVIDDLFDFDFIEPNFKVPAHLWRGSISAETGQPIASHSNEITAIKNVYGAGEVFWAPSLIGLGSRIKGNYHKLYKLLYQEAAESINSLLFRFAEPYEGLLMKTMKSKYSYLTIIINKSQNQKYIELLIPENMSSQIIYPEARELSSNTILIDDEETLVILWQLNVA